MQLSNVITINSDSCSLSLSPMHGGMVTSIIMQAPEGARELLYFGAAFDFANYHSMNGGMPFCFPICGRLMNSQYKYQGEIYHMKTHGFAYLMPWEVVCYDKDTLNLRLIENENTLKQYPFRFEVMLSYKIKNNELICYQRYENKCHVPLPYYAGFHPYLRLPFFKEEIFLNYHPKKLLKYNNDLTEIIGEEKCFKTPTNLLLPELNESLTLLGDNRLISLSFPDNSILEVEAYGAEEKNLFPYVQLYHELNEPFLCIEPWMGVPNALNHVTSVRWLKPGEIEHGIFYLRLKIK